MGCVQAKSSINSPIQRIDKLKQNNGYYKREREVGPINPKQPGNGEGERDKVVGRESGRGKRVVPTKIGGEELVDGWPRWLADNIPRDVLAGLVPRSADSYDKLAKVSIIFILFYFDGEVSNLVCI